MAKNNGNGKRTGIVKNRTQTYNEKTGMYMKRDENGKFMSGKSTPYKAIRKETPKKKTTKTTKTISTKSTKAPKKTSVKSTKAKK
jgi:hypothetical protein